MYNLPNHLHQPHKIGPLDTEDMGLAVVFYLFANIISIYSLLITVPLLFFIIKTKDEMDRGYIKHSLYYNFDLWRADGYPPISEEVFYE